MSKSIAISMKEETYLRGGRSSCSGCPEAGDGSRRTRAWRSCGARSSASPWGPSRESRRRRGGRSEAAFPQDSGQTQFVIHRPVYEEPSREAAR